MIKKEFYIPSADGVHRLHVILWEPDTEVKGVVQISHGMIEMVERYEDFALFLNRHGYAVIGNDHLGHGLTAGNNSDLGYICPSNMSATVVADLHRVTKCAKKKFKNVPYFLFGHSMGSFMARRYLMRYGMDVDGAILAGTGAQSSLILAIGNLQSGFVRMILGDRYRSRFLKASAFGSYQRRIPHPRTQSDWLTRDVDVVDFCLSNKYCNYLFTVNGYRTILEVLSYIQKKENIDRIPKEMPILLMSGGQDPVGNYGKGVKKVYDSYKKAGIQDVSMKLYPDDRHEILNELNKDIVYQNVLKWLTQHIG
ncbi:MAG: alpha/beta hydrolase [Lachnospiraceae bacterium]|nr:alpha/beta hydrolase [Lachnospiraceae bacterium]